MKKIKFVLILIILCLIFLIFLLLKYGSNKKEGMNIVINEEGVQDKFYVENYVQLYRTYNGEVNLDNFQNKLQTIARGYLPKLYKNLKDCNDKDLKTYYTKNQNEINSNLGINDFETFNKLVKCLKKHCKDSVKITHAQIDISEYTEKDNFAKFKVIFYIESNDKIEFTVSIKIKKKDNGVYISFIPIIEE